MRECRFTACAILLFACVGVNSARSAQERRESTIDYAPIPLSRLIGIAELVIVGRVDRIDDDHYTLQIDSVLEGNPESAVIAIAKHAPWPGSEPREAPYALGQAFLVFLARDDAREGPWHTLGIGGEGEMPIEDGRVYFRGEQLPGLESKRVTVHGAERTLQSFDRTAFAHLVVAYRQCFAWRAAETEGRWTVARLCGEETTQRLATQGPLHAFVLRQTERHVSVERP